MTRWLQATTGIGLGLLVLTVVFLTGFTPATLPEQLPGLSHLPQAFEPQSISAASIITGVAITDQGFYPPTLTITAGTTIYWTNETSQTQQIEGIGPDSGTQSVFLPIILKASGGAGQASAASGSDLAASGGLTTQDANWQSGDIPPGGVFSHIFDRPGRYIYHFTLSPTLSPGKGWGGGRTWGFGQIPGVCRSRKRPPTAIEQIGNSVFSQAYHPVSETLYRKPCYVYAR